MIFRVHAIYSGEYLKPAKAHAMVMELWIFGANPDLHVGIINAPPYSVCLFLPCLKKYTLTRIDKFGTLGVPGSTIAFVTMAIGITLLGVFSFILWYRSRSQNKEYVYE